MDTLLNIVFCLDYGAIQKRRDAVPSAGTEHPGSEMVRIRAPFLGKSWEIIIICDNSDPIFDI